MSNDPVPVSLFESIPLMADFDAGQQERLAALSTIRAVPAGTEVFHEGDAQDFLYIVLDGRVALEIHVPNRGRLRILTVETHEFLGWSSVAETAPRRTATARAVCDSRLLAIDANRLRQACQEDCALGFVMMRHVANLIAGRLIATRMQLLDMFANSTPEGSHG